MSTFGIVPPTEGRDFHRRALDETVPAEIRGSRDWQLRTDRRPRLFNTVSWTASEWRKWNGLVGHRIRMLSGCLAPLPQGHTFDLGAVRYQWERGYTAQLHAMLKDPGFLAEVAEHPWVSCARMCVYDRPFIRPGRNSFPYEEDRHLIPSPNW